MRIAILFHFCNEAQPAAVTEVEGSITDAMIPFPGDTVSHCDLDGSRFRAQVVGRHFDYSLTCGEDVGGAITVVLALNRLAMQ